MISSIPESYQKKMVILSGPAGSGKSTLIGMLMKNHPNKVEFSISCTTRHPRPSEIDGVHYYFITKDEFEKRILNHQFVEYALVHDNYYGTSEDEVMRIINTGKICLLDIDVQGAKIVLSKYPFCRSIFIEAPSIDELERRLRNRHTDSEKQINIRLKTAQKELLQREKYNIKIINDNLETAYGNLETEILNLQRRC